MLLFFFVAFSFSGMLCAFILLLLNRVDVFANRLLAMGLLNSSTVILLSGLTYVDNFYLFYPHLFRLGVFLQYLLAPFFYLYVRATINREVGFQKWDWLHFVPALLHFIEFIPFYLMPTAEKVAYLKIAFSHVEILSEQKEGLLPAHLHPILKAGTGIVYAFFQARLLYFSRRNNSKWLSINKRVWTWLISLTFSHSLIYIFVFLFSIFNIGVDLRIWVFLSFGVVQFFCAITLVFNPRVLYGMIETLDVTALSDIVDQTESSSKKFILSIDKKKLYIQKLDSFIESEKPYLKKKYSIREFATDCNIPVHHLSIVINEEYGCNYTDFINSYRINYIIDHRYSEKFNSFSFEGLSSEAGFNSRNSFLNAFKKVTGETPSCYFKKKHNSIKKSIKQISFL